MLKRWRMDRRAGPDTDTAGGAGRPHAPAGRTRPPPDVARCVARSAVSNRHARPDNPVAEVNRLYRAATEEIRAYRDRGGASDPQFRTLLDVELARARNGRRLVLPPTRPARRGGVPHAGCAGVSDVGATDPAPPLPPAGTAAGRPGRRSCAQAVGRLASDFLTVGPVG